MKFKTTLLAFSLSLQIALAQFNYMSPIPGSQYHNPQTNIILKNGKLINKASIESKKLIQITGSISGEHKWTARLTQDNKTIIIHPVPEFAYDETVAVSVSGL
ncbi:MAG: hypothetical protein ABI729_08405, partial [Chitinophagales bacterium]